VDRHRVPLPLDVLDVLRAAEFLELLGADDVRQVMTSRPLRIAVISASLTMSLMVAPVAYG
jgi:hypothetical protein